jgi:hypothetical protein
MLHANLRGLGLLALFATFGCSGTADVPSRKPPIESGGSGGGGSGSGGSSATGGSGATGGGINIGGSGPRGGSGNSGDAGAGAGDECEPSCGTGQRCVTADGESACVDVECDELDCEDDEECRPAAGGGNYCADNSCDGDVDCPINRFCDDGVCVEDTCEAGTRTCNGEEVHVCASNGGEETVAYSCGSGGYFTSSCDDSDASNAGCGCEDDWDCPEHTTCDAGTCVGRGTAPTCTLPPVAFEDIPPALEFRWGGTDNDNPAATGSPFSLASQVVSTPIVINLDDDNADGKVNELDFPEILFMSYSTEVAKNGVVRAVHGGGPNKGKDYFALCGTAHWLEGDELIDECPDGDGVATARARPGGTLAAGDLDYDGFPEIVVPLEDGRLQILNARGEIITTYEQDLRFAGPWFYPAPAIANLDFAGFAEIVVGNRVVTLKHTDGVLEFDRVFVGSESDGTMQHQGAEAGQVEGHHGPTVCLSDLRDDFDGLEIVAGPTAYRLPDAVADCDPPNDTSDFCQGRLTIVWDAPAIDAGEVDYENGFCAIADVWGADTAVPPGPENQLDRKPEVVLISNGELLILDGATGAVILARGLGGGVQGGAPNVDDFDGDGFPEIATALAEFYTVIDLQTPTTACPAWDSVMDKTTTPPDGNPERGGGGECDSNADCDTAGTVCNAIAHRCVCLHNGWKRATEDDSSRVTSSSVFDFNGDGAAEVVYNDECYFHIYDGATGGVYLALPSLSRTIDENPVVADVDNDGNAEIIFATNNETLQCGETALDSWPDGTDDVPRASLPNGLEVWGDPTDVWVAARRIWNQHSYHVTNVTESGTLPLHEPEHWKPLNERLYNTFRSQPRSYGVAPDLALVGIQISSPDVACGELSDTIQISVEVRNQGDLRVGPGVIIEFEGTFADPDLEAALEDDDGDALIFTLQQSLEPGASVIITVEYEAGRNDRDDLPVSVRATIDGDDKERECNEDNNSIEAPVEAGARVADLRVKIEDASGCSPPEVEVTVTNDGSAEASDVLIRFYAGDPSQGGSQIGETTIDGPIAGGDSETVTVTLDVQSRNITVWAVVDPLNTIAECNDGNNRDEGPSLNCDTQPR